MEITEKPEVVSDSTELEKQQEQVDISNVSVNINAQFLYNYKNILDASIERGTWKGNELTQTGAIYQSLNNILQQVIEKVKSAQTNPGVEPGVEPGPETGSNLKAE